jgi:hypothetical protein
LIVSHKSYSRKNSYFSRHNSKSRSDWCVGTLWASAIASRRAKFEIDLFRPWTSDIWHDTHPRAAIKQCIQLVHSLVRHQRAARYAMNVSQMCRGVHPASAYMGVLKPRTLQLILIAPTLMWLFGSTLLFCSILCRHIVWRRLWLWQESKAHRLVDASCFTIYFDCLISSGRARVALLHFRKTTFQERQFTYNLGLYTIHATQCSS